MIKFDSKILNRPPGCQSLAFGAVTCLAPRLSLAAALHKGKMEGGADMGYIIAWLLGVPVTLLVLFWLFFGR